MPGPGEQSSTTLRFFFSSDITLPVQFRLDELSGIPKDYGPSPGEPGNLWQYTDVDYEPLLYVEAQVFVEGMALGLPESTSCVGRDPDGVFRWKEWLGLPARYCDLTSTAQLALTVRDMARSMDGKHLVGGTTVRLFNDPHHKPPLPAPAPPSQHADLSAKTPGQGSVHLGTGAGAPAADQATGSGGTAREASPLSPSATPAGAGATAGAGGGAVGASSSLLLLQQQAMLKMGRTKLQLWMGRGPDGGAESSTPGKVPRGEASEAERLESLVAMYDRGEIPRVGWLDRLTFPIIDAVIEEEDAAFAEGGGDMPRSLLSLEFPTFDHPVAYQELGGFLAAPTHPLPSTNQIVTHVWDPEVMHRHVPNPAELKQLKLTRMLDRGTIDRQLKPNLQERKEITAALKQPPTHSLTKEEVQLLWRFRFSLTSDKHALTKFLRCVDWSDASEASQATELMLQWTPIDTADALELLSPSFLSEQVRAYAVTVLQRTSDEELQSYLLQLVHALRYERTDNSDLAAFLIGRGCSNFVLANFLHWYLRVERQDPNFAARYAHVHDRLLASLLQLGSEGRAMHETISRQSELDLGLCQLMLELKAVRGGTARKVERLRQLLQNSEVGESLTDFGTPLALPLDPTLSAVGLIPEECSVFKSALNPLKLTFRMASEPQRRSGRHTAAAGRHGAEEEREAHSNPGNGKTGRGEASGSGQSGPKSSLEERASEQGQGPDNSGEEGKEGTGLNGHLKRKKIIFKKGDDLRQDQLVIQMISLMDRLLKKENLDLKLTPYRVLATSSDQGYVEFIPSVPLAQVLAEHRSIVRYLYQFHPNPEAPPGSPPSLSPQCLDTFLRSCAGYCVIMYILGVGDRHLDNLLLCEDGRLFHIDFGFILGRDPKPFPPPMKLCREMVDVMGVTGGASGSGGAGEKQGGTGPISTTVGNWDSNDYRKFRSYCCEAFNILRSHNRLILNLFHLMAHSSIPDFAADPEKVVYKVEQKFRLDLDDGAAVQFIQALIHESVSALFPQMVETIHRWSQYWR